jgi:hypothetical protein
MIWRVYPLAIGAAFSCLGYGFGIARLLGISVNLGDAGILGLTCLAILGCAIHFVFALSTIVEIVTLGAGLALCVVFHKELIRQSRRNSVAILVGTSAFFHRYAFTFYDTGLYHLQSVKWNSEFPIVLGLGNLHGRLAFNSVLYVMAPLDDRPEFGWVTGLLLLLFVLMACYARFSEASSTTLEFWFCGLAVAVLALGSMGPLGWGGVLNADGAAAILTVYWFCLALSAPARPQTHIPLLLISGMLAMTVKLSAAPLFALALGVAWLYRKSGGVALLKPILVSAMLFSLWMARGFALSGCAVYPIAQTCKFDLPWAVSRAQAAGEALSIRAWARAPHRLDYAKVTADWSWLAQWAVRTLQDWSAELFLFGGIAAGVSVLAGARVNRAVTATLVGLVFCLAYWFITAPDVRFGSGYLTTGGLLALSVVCAAYFPETDVMRRLTVRTVALSALLGIAGLVQWGNRWTIQPMPAVVARMAPGGKSIWVTQSDQQGGDQCWDHQLPCTPYFNSANLNRVQWR